MSEIDSLRKDLPHLIVLVALVVILLVVLTKFQWIHCSQIPGWCNAYCSVITRSHSRVGLVSGEDGIGDPQALYNIIQRERGYTYLEQVGLSQLSSGSLKGYDLVILEKMKTVSSREAKAIKDYVDRGGSVLWIGDAATVQIPDQYDLLKAREANATFYDKLYRAVASKNETLEDQYAKDQIKRWEDTDDYKILVRAGLQKEYDATGAVKDRPSPTPSFEKLKDVLGARYVETRKLSTPVDFEVYDRNHYLTRGLKARFTADPGSFAEVAEDASRVTKIAGLKTPDGKTYPFILEARYTGRVVFFAYPLEASNSTTLVGNVVDYLVPC